MNAQETLLGTMAAHLGMRLCCLLVGGAESFGWPLPGRGVSSVRRWVKQAHATKILKNGHLIAHPNRFEGFCLPFMAIFSRIARTSAYLYYFRTATLDTLPGPNAASHKAAPCQESLRPEIPDEELDGMVPIKTSVDADDVERLMTVLSVSVGPPLAKVAVGREAARSLMIEAVAKHRTHLQDQFKRDRGEEPNSVLLEQRLATDTWHPDHGRPPNPSSQGDDLDLLFRALLGSLEGRGHISHMKEPPLVATNPSLFHSQFWRKFVDGCSEPWTEMSPQNKRKRLRDWMYQKFSLDPQSRCMLPGPGSKRKKRNEACWFGFELTDADLEHVLRDTMETYLAAHS